MAGTEEGKCDEGEIINEIKEGEKEGRNTLNILREGISVNSKTL